MLRIFRHHLSAPALLLFFLENSIITLTFYYVTRRAIISDVGSLPVSLPTLTMSNALLLAFVISAIMWSIGLYDKWHLADLKRVGNRLLVSFVIGYSVLVLPLYMQTGQIFETFRSFLLVLALTMSAALASVFVTRLVCMRVADVAKLDRKILVLGVGPRAGKIEQFTRQQRDRGFEVVGYVRSMNEKAEVDPDSIVSDSGTLLETVRRLGVEEIVVAMTDRRGVPLEPLLECRLEGVIITDYLTFWERETGQVMLDALDPSWLIYSDGFRLGSFVNGLLKRTFDVAVGILFVILTLPLMLAVAVAVRLDSAGPVFYKQERVGRNGRPFVLFKFRSMKTDAEKMGIPQWAAVKDPRITRIGAFLRKTRIDEIPQVLNVLKGDMSFIGPRPERPFFVESLSKEIPYYRERCRVRPGITGWAQINYPYGASIEDAKEKLSYDCYYIKNYSLMLDLLVLMATVQVVFWPKGVR